MPIDAIAIETVEARQDVYRVDDDAILQVVALAQAAELPVAPIDDGYRVTRVVSGSVFDLAGLRPLDELTHINGVPVRDARLLAKAYASLRSTDAIRLDLRRGGKAMTLTYERRPAESAGALGHGEANAKGDSGDVAPTSSAEAALPDAIRGGITKLGPNRYQLKRSTIDAILQDQAALMRSARIVPERKGDAVVGLRLFGIRAGSLLHQLGFENGDRVETMNGFALSDPSKALEAYQKLRGATQLKIAIVRKGKPLTLEYRIVN
jgi:type II secretory pathway component PulC